MTNGFPSTGFIGAEFTLEVAGMAADYTWSNGGNAWTTVDNTGKVTFTAKGDLIPVTITATPKAGGAPRTYTFTVGSWFINNGSTTMKWFETFAWCTSQAATPPTRAQLTQGTSTRGVGSLWSEWGEMGNYGNSGFSSSIGRHFNWTTESAGPDSNYLVNLNDGSEGRGGSTDASPFASSNIYVVCQQGL
ncbi:hypothetical protein WKA22_003839 [Yersinia enterocolitica]